MKTHRLLTIAVIIYMIWSAVSMMKLIDMNHELNAENQQLKNHVSELSQQIIKIQENMIIMGYPELANVNSEE